LAPAIYAAAVGEAAAGIEFEAPPLSFKAIKDGCAFFRTAVETGGKNYDQPQWNLTTLISTFVPDPDVGRALAHKMGNMHPGYDRASTDDLFDRKQREKAANGIGWPSCAAIEQAGCKDPRALPASGQD
jgi:hypothetical protein